ALRKGHGKTRLAEHREGLWTGDLVDQVQTDEELRLPGVERADRVQLPNLVEQTPSHGKWVVSVLRDRKNGRLSSVSTRNANCSPASETKIQRTKRPPKEPAHPHFRG